MPGGANDILCTAERTCFAVGAFVQRTTDGGVSWTSLGGFSGTLLQGLTQTDPATLYAVGTDLTVLKSTSGGAMWTRKTVSGVPFANLPVDSLR